MAASVAVVQGPVDHGHKWKSSLKSFQLNRRRSSFAGGDASSDLRPLSGAVGSDFSGVLGNCEERRNHADESIQKVMYLNCWGQG
ncbi:hypothetical protein C1H46_022065 [Malus baccata]|uniref:Uncharacterized protein n=1 Tax=Malus baccata TaxID=106549 RepID=A0A540M0T9_MALBA|nr:hypothetical protein C1H46_022065 [Malus baccata]